MATIPSIASVVAGPHFTAPLYNGIKAFCDFLIDTPHCSVFQTTATSIPNGATMTLLGFDAETDDSDSMHSTVTNNSRIIFTTGGRYEFTPFVTLVAATFTVYSVNVRKNSAGSSAGGTSLRTWPSDAVTSRQFPLPTMTAVFSATDYIEVFAAQTSGAARLTDSAGGQFGVGVQARFLGLT